MGIRLNVLYMLDHHYFFFAGLFSWHPTLMSLAVS